MLKKNNDAIQLITSNGILKDEKYGPNGGKFIYAVDLLNGKFPEDNHLISDQKLLNLKVEYINMPTKSPVKAGILSTMLPGSGRVYTNDWKNGLLGFYLLPVLDGNLTAGLKRVVFLLLAAGSMEV